MNAKPWIGLVLTCVLSSASGCGDSASDGENGGAGGSGDATSSTGSTSTSSSPSAQQISCQNQCEKTYPEGFATFVNYELQQCGCTPNAACADACAGEDQCDVDATQPNSGPPTSDACKACLTSEGASGIYSDCTLAAGTDIGCIDDEQCNHFVSCGIACD